MAASILSACQKYRRAASWDEMIIYWHCFTDILHANNLSSFTDVQLWITHTVAGKWSKVHVSKNFVTSSSLSFSHVFPCRHLSVWAFGSARQSFAPKLTNISVYWTSSHKINWRLDIRPHRYTYYPAFITCIFKINTFLKFILVLRVYNNMHRVALSILWWLFPQETANNQK